MNHTRQDAQAMKELTRFALRDWPLPQHDGGSDKEDRGSVLVIAGSREIPGAAILAATAALRSGAGKLTIATVASVAASVAIAVPEARVIALPENPAGEVLPEAARLLEKVSCRAAAALIGPGLMEGQGNTAFVETLLGFLKDTAVILDAAAMDVVLNGQAFDQPVLLTPHAGEMAHLTGRSKDDVQDNGLQIALDMAARHNAVVALKGATTFIVSSAGAGWRHAASIPGLGTSGSGDVLAGIITGLAARGAPLEQAAVWGVLLHAAAGKRLSGHNGPLGFLARELLVEIPVVMRN
jgi:ADP-dependent NAD(P)H-hydrate dehydratase